MIEVLVSCCYRSFKLTVFRTFRVFAFFLCTGDVRLNIQMTKNTSHVARYFVPPKNKKQCLCDVKVSRWKLHSIDTLIDAIILQ